MILVGVSMITKKDFQLKVGYSHVLCVIVLHQVGITFTEKIIT
jgi:hypothetical protein